MNAEGVLNSTALRLAAPRRLPEAIAQANVIIEAHQGNVRKFVLGPNAMPGRAFRPLTGYAMEVSLDAQFVPAHYDTQNLFRGRCVLPLIPVSLGAGRCEEKMSAMKMCITDRSLIQVYEEARQQALAQINEDPDQMSLMDATSGPGFCCLFLDESSGNYLLAVEAHMLPDREAIAEDISAYLAREGQGLTVSQAFFRGHPVGRTMIRYMRAQKMFRESLCRRVRAMMLQQFLGDVAYDDTDPALHFITNVANMTSNQDGFLYYSEMLEATMEGGALIAGGPFKRSLWVNWNGGLGEALLAAGTLRAVPFDMPTSMTVPMTLQKIIESRGSERDPEEFAAVISGDKQHKHHRNYAHLSHDVVKSLAGDNKSGPLGMARRTESVVGDLVYPHYQASNGEQIPIISPFEYIPYVRGLEFEGTLAAMRALGVDPVQSAASIVALSPLFCAADPPSVEAALALATASASATCKA